VPAIAAIALCGLAAAGTYWYYSSGDADPQPPAVDLSRAEPEVASAVTAALASVRESPRDAERWGRLGMCLRAHDFDTDSIDAFRTAARLDPSDYRWPYLEGLTLVLYQPVPGLECFRRAAALAPSSRPEPRLKVAELLLERGEAGAEEFAAAVLETEPGNGRAHLVLARAAAARGDWPAAFERATRALADPAARRPATLLRGQAHAARGEREKAEAEFRAAAALPDVGSRVDPVVAEVERLRVGTNARVAAASQLIAEGRGRDAIAILDEAARAAPNSPEPALKLGETLILAQNPAGARRVLEAFTVRFPESVEGWFQLGVARFQTSDVAQAREAFRQAIALKPDHALAHFNLGHCHRKLGDAVAARAAFGEALRCRPDYRAAREAIAELDKSK
jgi:tetratricopeptide (TPR) repeat protein